MSVLNNSRRGAGPAEAPPGRPRLLVVSHVLPFPGDAGQQQRVAYTLAAARKVFEVDFLTCAAPDQAQSVRSRLAGYCDQAIVLPSAAQAGPMARVWHKALGLAYMALTGLKESNYRVGKVELSRAQLARHARPEDYACVLFEYVHAAAAAGLFAAAGVPTVVDTHNVLWRARQGALQRQTFLPGWLRRRWLGQYRRAEEAAWAQFDHAIAINRAEEAYIRASLPPSKTVFYAPMGIDLARWTCCWEPAQPPRLAFYGGLGSPVNQHAVRRCLDGILPGLWERWPGLEFWIVGSRPPEWVRALASARIKVTGFVEDPAPVLKTMTAVVCPWSAAYGFRSRLVEVMSLGVPVVCSAEAAEGMEFEHEQGVWLGCDDAGLAAGCGRLLADRSFAARQSQLARRTTERLYSADHTYGRLVEELARLAASGGRSKG